MVVTKDDSKRSKSTVPLKPQSRSFCCTMFVYTFVFVSGVIVATILPDLAGHHFKQPYGKEYAAMAEQMFHGLPKYLQKFRELAVVVTDEIGNRIWDLKTEIEKRMNGPSTSKSTSRTTAKTTTNKANKGHGHSHSHSHSHSHGGHHHESDDEDL